MSSHTVGSTLDGTLPAVADVPGQTSLLTESEAVAAADKTANCPLASHCAPSAGAGVTEIPYTRLGLKIFRAILILIALMVVLLSVFAAITYPTAADARAVVGSATGSAALKDWQDLQSQWFNQVTRLTQFLIFGSVLPLLTTVVGYLLGMRRGN